MKKLLLLSNSTNFGETYMQWCKDTIASFSKEYKNNIVFIPYAAVGFSYDDYTEKVNTALSEVNITVNNLDNYKDVSEALRTASAIFVGGGNTFHLLKTLQDKKLVAIIKNKVAEGVPYVGWSAGSNIASPTICTTNDMPIVEPQSFNALDLVPYQINPHYTSKTIQNHGGETRTQRLQEYLAANKKEEVICLPEASYVEVVDTKSVYKGGSNAKLMTYSSEKPIPHKSSISK